MPKALIIICVFIVLTVSDFNLYAKEPANTNPEISNSEKEALWLTFSQINREVQRKMYVEQSSQSYNSILSKKCDISWNNQAEVEALLADAERLDGNFGLSVRGGYTSKDITDNFTDDDGSSYLELSWDILKSGYKEYDSKAKSRRLQAEIKQLEGELKKLGMDYRCRRHHIAGFFSDLEAYFLKLRLELMDSVYDIEKRAYFSGWSLFDELLISEEDIELARQELSYLENNPYHKTFQGAIVNPPIINVNLSAIIESINNDRRYEQVHQLMQQRIRENIDYQDGARFRVFVRKEFENNDFSDEGLVAGLRFSVPFSGSQKDSKDYQIAQLKQESNFERWERTEKTRAAYEQFREQLSRVTKLHYSYLKSNEKIRRINAYAALGEELEISSVIARLRTLVHTSLELIRAKKELYRRVNEIFVFAKIEFNEKYIQAVETKETDYRARAGERSIYLWSKTFNQLSNQQILHLLGTKNITKVLLSIGKNINSVKRDQFLELAEKNNINVEVIIGSNNWIKEDHHLVAKNAINKTFETYNSIHLDLEPQAYKGTELEKNRLKTEYLKLIKELGFQENHKKLSVAVPYHWKDEDYRLLQANVDKIYVMFYGTDKTETIVRRINRIKNLIPDSKLSITLSVLDFDNEWEMEKSIEQLIKVTGIKDITLHNLKLLIEKSGSPNL